MARQSQAQKIASYATGHGAALLCALRDNGPMDTWDGRHTIWANSWNLLTVKKKKLTLTALGKKVADLL